MVDSFRELPRSSYFSYLSILLSLHFVVEFPQRFSLLRSMYRFPGREGLFEDSELLECGKIIVLSIADDKEIVI